MPEALDGDVLIVVGDDVSTGDMAPDGIGMSLWANIPECARYMFDRLDPEFTDRALERGGGFVVGGDNYGQGSSREQAALSALHLGVRAVIAKSFARIHRSNLIAQGILPLRFVDPDDHQRTEQDEHWRLDGVRDAIEAGHTRLAVGSDTDRSIELAVDLGDRERAVLLAGGTLNHLQEVGSSSS
jgi:aconitate hydratase